MNLLHWALRSLASGRHVAATLSSLLSSFVFGLVTFEPPYISWHHTRGVNITPLFLGIDQSDVARWWLQQMDLFTALPLHSFSTVLPKPSGLLAWNNGKKSKSISLLRTDSEH